MAACFVAPGVANVLLSYGMDTVTAAFCYAIGDDEEAQQRVIGMAISGAIDGVVGARGVCDDILETAYGTGIKSIDFDDGFKGFDLSKDFDSLNYNKSFADLMSPEEAARYNEYWDDLGNLKSTTIADDLVDDVAKYADDVADLTDDTLGSVYKNSLDDVDGFKGLNLDESSNFFKNADEVVEESAKVAKESTDVALKEGIYSVGNATFMDSDDSFLRYIQNRSNIDADGYYDIVAHGTPNGIQITHNGQHMIVDHRITARLIQNTNGYNGQAIRLLSCNTGALDNGFAQNLANRLNVEVYAPTNYLWAKQDGSYFVAGMTNQGRPDMSELGIFRIFVPGGNI